jgi:DNA phosphorothioation-dependent restriction protein DptG
MINKLRDIEIQEISKKNSLGNYYPLSSKDNHSQSIFDERAILGLIMSYISNRKIKKKFEFQDFQKSCKSYLQEKISEVKYVDMICKIYLDSDTYLKLSPLMYQLYKSDSKKDKSNKAFNIIFKPLLDGISFDIDEKQNLNFIEQHIVESLLGSLEENTIDKNVFNELYLEFLGDFFKKDFLFLSENREYFVENIDKLIKLYIFIYTSQLALNLNKNHIFDEPKAEELFFILNTEKTSLERKKLSNYGYKTLFEKVGYLFPYLSLLETLSSITEIKNLKFYDLLSNIDDTQENIEIIDAFNNKFRVRSELERKKVFSNSLKEAIETLLNSSYQQFMETANNSKISVFKKFKTAFENHIAKGFIQSRGRFGKVCVLDQEMIIFITNLAIGEDKDFLHFDELMIVFQQRGIYFDQKSKEALLALFERVENIERKSDSGDSIYVYKTV